MKINILLLSCLSAATVYGNDKREEQRSLFTNPLLHIASNPFLSQDAKIKEIIQKVDYLTKQCCFAPLVFSQTSFAEGEVWREQILVALKAHELIQKIKE
jgi:hypothetical protein